ncbi:MAG: hypothetical protein LBP60_01040 [Spirochaetaceae bacterium]|nr:hypothetical protein [Spirochaetaceae bacterium]
MAGTQDRIRYRIFIAALKKQRGGVTVGDMAAITALPFHCIRNLLSRAAAEYNGRLEVGNSGEIFYSFPRGFVSRYRGLGPACSRFFEKTLTVLKSFFAAAFKVWIAVMLAGYFILFVFITLAFLCAIIAANVFSNTSRKNQRYSGGLTGAHFRLLNGIFRFWFYKTLLDPGAPPVRGPGHPKNSDTRPLYKKVFSFVFGEGEPNKDWEKTEALGIIDYLRRKNGLIALPEFVILSGLEIQQAEQKILSYCVNYGGMPEATGEGTVVYRFDSLLVPGNKRASSSGDGFSAPSKKPWKFSLNTHKTNRNFGLINLVNLGFGSYFLYYILNPVAAGTSSFSGPFYFVYRSLLFLNANPLLVIGVGLGIIPVLFSLLFWAVPALRAIGIKKKNAAIDLENQRKKGFSTVWNSPLEVTGDTFKDPQKADRFIKEIGAYSIPDVTIDPRGRPVYIFKGLEEERQALERYRKEVERNRENPGAIVFDSDL